MTARAVALATILAAVALPGAAQALVGTTSDTAGVFFYSEHALAAGDTSPVADLYLRKGATTSVVSTGSSAPDQQVLHPSDDGSVVLFTTAQALLGADTDATPDYYVRTPDGLAVIAPQAANLPFVVATTPDGSRFLLQTEEALLVADGDAKTDIYEFDVKAQALTLRTTGIDGEDVFLSASSPDATELYVSTAKVLAGADTDTAVDVYRLSGGSYTLVTPGNADATFGAVGATTPRVVFSTAASLTAADTDTKVDVYSVHNGAVTLLSPSVQPANKAQDVSFQRASASDAGRVLFRTNEALLAGDQDTTEDLYVHDGNSLKLLTATSQKPVGVAGVADELGVVLVETSEPLLAADTDTSADLYRIVPGGLTTLVADTDNGFEPSDAELSGDGFTTAFTTDEPIVAADTDTSADWYVLANGSLRLASVRDSAVAGGPPQSVQHGVFLSSGAFAFSTEERLLPTDRDDALDTYAYVDDKVVHLSADGYAPETVMAAPSGSPLTAALSANETVTYECRADGGAWSACASPWTVPAGAQVVEARATDLAGNVDATPASRTLDVPPATSTPTPTPTASPSPTPSASPTPTPTASPTPEPDAVAPVISGASVKGRRKPQLRLTVSEAATLRVTVQRKRRGAWRRRSATAKATNAGAFAFRLARFPRRGTFRVVVVATDAAGNRSAPKRIRVRRAK